MILWNHVLEHIPDDQKAMQELFRVIHPKGWGIFQMPQDLRRKPTFEDPSITDKEERRKFFGQHDHVRIYGQDFFDILKGFWFYGSMPIDYTKDIDPTKSKTFAWPKGKLSRLVVNMV